MVTFGDTCCAQGSTAYFVLVWFHADGAAPELRFLYGRVARQPPSPPSDPLGDHTHVTPPALQILEVIALLHPLI